MKDVLRLVVVGVGGQGVLFASKVISQGAMAQGKDVVMSEVHGMAQRGGSVVCNVCIGEVKSPLVADSQADVILGFEPVETYRSIAKANAMTRVVTSTSPVVPVGVSIGEDEYPEIESIFSEIRTVTNKLTVVDSDTLARQAGNYVTANSVMLGALAGTPESPVGKNAMLEIVKGNVPQQTIDMNVKAFELGFCAGSR
jgi:indolepyruvate ferredoxin oxidoreductase beta subunit